jgi:hypothetical protein
MFNIARLVGPMLLVGGAGYALADSPTAPTTAATAAAPTTATSMAAKPAASAAAAPTASTEEQTAAMRKMARGLGLSPRNQKGVEVYCSKSAELGTRFETLHCYSSQQVVELDKRKQSNQDDVEAMRKASLTEPPKNN